MYTNKHNLPEEIVAALTKDRYNPEGEQDVGDYSVTMLCRPVQQIVLQKRYADNVKTFDVIDNYWAFIGSIAHKVLEEHGSDECLKEKRFYLSRNGFVISGQVDHYKDQIITDYKSTKVYKIMKNEFSDWERQLNLYAWLAELNGYPVKKIRIFAFILDYKKHESFKQNYPKCPIVEIPITLWDVTHTDIWVKHRLEEIEFASKLSDEELAMHIPCTPHEMWQDTRDIALMKKGSTRARKVFKDAQEALTWKLKDDEILVTRYGQRKRCYEYCAVSNVCLQHKRLSGKGDYEQEPLF